MALIEAHGQLRSKIFVTGFVADVQVNGPDEIRGEASDQDHHQHWQALPKNRGAVTDCQRFDRIAGRQSVQGWASGSSKDSEDTLNFCALTGIRPMIEEFALEDAAKGYERMITNRARFRAVLVSR